MSYECGWTHFKSNIIRHDRSLVACSTAKFSAMVETNEIKTCVPLILFLIINGVYISVF